MNGELRDCLENLFPDSSVSAEPCTALRQEVARGGTAAVHVLLNGLVPGTVVTPAVRGKQGVAAEAKWFQLVDVPVEVNTGPVGFVEKDGERNAHVIRRAPFRTYDALAPVDGSLRAPAATMALRLQLPIPRTARAGERHYTLQLRAGKETLTFALAVVIHAVAIPPVGRISFPYTNWFSYALIAERHELRPWSEAHWRMLRRYAELMAHARQNMFWVPQPDIFRVTDSGMPTLNVKRLRRIVETFSAAGLYYIEGGHFGRRTTDEWTCPSFSLELNPQSRDLAARQSGYRVHQCATDGGDYPQRVG